MKVIQTLAGIAPLLVLFACSNPADDVPAAAVGPASRPAKETAKATEASRYFAFGPDSSAVEFIGSKVTGSHNGGFRKFAGELNVVDGRVADSGNKVVIETGSLWSDNERLTGHLKSPDFFGVSQHPAATFVSTSVKQTGTEATVTGNLTLHGVTKQISFPAKIEVSPETVTINSEFFLNRFDFEMKYPGKADDLIRKEVVLKLKVKAAPGRADFKAVEQAAAPTRPSI